MAWEMAGSEEDHLNEVELRATHHHPRQTTIRPKGQQPNFAQCKMHEKKWEPKIMTLTTSTVSLRDLSLTMKLPDFYMGGWLMTKLYD